MIVASMVSVNAFGICPTTIRYPGIHVIDTAGEVVDYYLHTARDRL